MSGPTIKDADWVKQAFLVNSANLDDIDISNGTFTMAEYTFMDTTPGGNTVINPPPQFTRYADIKPMKAGLKDISSTSKSSKGMGRYYYEAIDSNAQRIHMRFGVPAFNSLTTFFTGFYDGNAGTMARTGRAFGAFYAIGTAVGFVVAITTWQIVAIQLIGLGLRFGLQKPSSKFYYLNPSMHLYWNAVTTMVNQISVNTGVIPRVGGALVGNGIGANNIETDQNTGPLAYNKGYEFGTIGLEHLHNLLPDVITKTGRIDVYAIANRAQRMARATYKNMEDVTNNADPGNIFTKIARAITDTVTKGGSKLNGSLESYQTAWLKASRSKPKPTPTTDAPPGPLTKTGTTTSQQATATTEVKETPVDQDINVANYEDATDTDWWSFVTAELDDGSAFVSFRVNNTGHVGESFSNSFKDSDLLQKMNSTSAAARDINFNVAGGHLNDAVGAVVDSAKDLLSGVLNSFSLSGIVALGGGAFVDIPQHWEAAVANLPKSTYTIDLVSPYGNKISQLLNIDIPLCMLLAGVLPIATGKQSYGSPLIMEMYDRGRCQTRLGMIESMTITRGTGNLGFNNEGRAYAVQVTFSVKDLSTVIAMPITAGFTIPKLIFGKAANTLVGAAGDGIAGNIAATALAGPIDDDSIFHDYMNVIGGVGLADQIYSSRKAKLALTMANAQWDAYFSASHFINFAGDVLPGRLLGGVFRGNARA